MHRVSVGGHRAFSSRVSVTRSRAFAGPAVGVWLGTLLVSVAGEQPAAAAYRPSHYSGYWWDVKTGRDPQASQVNLGSVTPTTVGYLTSLPARPILPDDYRLPPTEPSRTAATPVPAPGEAIRIRADIRNALKKEADRRVLGESYVAEVLIVKGVKELSPVELG